MNHTIYVDADFTLPQDLPKPGPKDLAETFDVSADYFDHEKPVRPVDGKPGTWRAGVKGSNAHGMTQQHPGKINVNRDDFYVKPN